MLTKNTMQAGTVYTVCGEATVFRFDEGRTSIRIGEPVRVGDIFETASGSWLTLLFTDGSELTIGANGRVSIDSFRFDPVTAQGHIEAWVLEGLFIFTNGMISGHDGNDTVVYTRDAKLTVAGGQAAGKADAVEQIALFSLLSSDDGSLGTARVETQAGTCTLERANETTVVSSKQHPPSPSTVLPRADLFDVYGVLRDKGWQYAELDPFQSRATLNRQAIPYYLMFETPVGGPAWRTT